MDAAVTRRGERAMVARRSRFVIAGIACALLSAEPPARIRRARSNPAAPAGSGSLDPAAARQALPGRRNRYVPGSQSAGRHHGSADPRNRHRSPEPLRHRPGKRAFPAVRGQDGAESHPLLQRGCAACRWASCSIPAAAWAPSFRSPDRRWRSSEDGQPGGRVLPGPVQRPAGS